MSSVLEEGLARYVSFGQLQALRSMRIGMAGLGGIGSNVALMLARTGATSLVLVDHDSVEKSNLNRQCYFPEDVGKAKTEALTERLRSLDENVRPLAVKERITRDNVRSILALADIWIEALDGAEDKAMLVEACLSARLPCIACSGMGGFGGAGRSGGSRPSRPSGGFRPSGGYHTGGGSSRGGGVGRHH